MRMMGKECFVTAVWIRTTFIGQNLGTTIMKVVLDRQERSSFMLGGQETSQANRCEAGIKSYRSTEWTHTCKENLRSKRYKTNAKITPQKWRNINKQGLLSEEKNEKNASQKQRNRSKQGV